MLDTDFESLETSITFIFSILALIASLSCIISILLASILLRLYTPSEDFVLQLEVEGK